MRVMILAVLMWSTALADRPVPVERFEVIARVTHSPPGPIKCGVIASIGDVRFDVVRVIRGRLVARELVVRVMCAEAFDVGDLYRLTIQPIPERTQPARRYELVRERRLRN